MEFRYYFKSIGGQSIRLYIEPNTKITGFIDNISGWLACDVQGAESIGFLILKKYLVEKVRKKFLLEMHMRLF